MSPDTTHFMAVAFWSFRVTGAIQLNLFPKLNNKRWKNNNNHYYFSNSVNQLLGDVEDFQYGKENKEDSGGFTLHKIAN